MPLQQGFEKTAKWRFRLYDYQIDALTDFSSIFNVPFLSSIPYYHTHRLINHMIHSYIYSKCRGSVGASNVPVRRISRKYRLPKKDLMFFK